MSDPLEALARRRENDPAFLATLLLAYARSEGLDDDGLAEAIGCPQSALPRLRLCQAPRPTTPLLGQDIDEISSAFGIEPDRLIDIVRRGQALLRARAGSAEPSLFLAARDADPPKDEEKP